MTYSQGDFNSDGKVDVADLTILSQSWQQTVVSPASVVLLVPPARPARRVPAQAVNLI
jgi:hypothetical protein